MKNKLATKAVVCAAATAMLFTSVPYSGPLVANAETTYETNESLKPDENSRMTVHDLSKLGDKVWTYNSANPSKPSQISWDSAHSVLTIQNLDLNVTNNDLSAWMAYFTYSGATKLTVKLKGTNNLALNGNVCFIQNTGTAGTEILSKGSTKSSLYVTMNPIEGSKTKDECHFIESYGDLVFGNGTNDVNVSVTTKGSSVNAYTNIYAKNDINVKGTSYVYSSIEAGSSKMSSNAIVALNNITIDAGATFIAKCNVADTTSPYYTVNQAVSCKTFNDAGSKLYVTNVNGHVINANTINIAAKDKALPNVTFKTADQKEVDSVPVKINFDGTYTTTGTSSVSGGSNYTNNITKNNPPSDNYLFYSEQAFVTDGNNFLDTTTNANDVTSLNYEKDEQIGEYYFKHANISGNSIPKKAKTIMSNTTMNLVAKASQVTAGVSYENGDVIIAIADPDLVAKYVDECKAGNTWRPDITIDGKIIDWNEWGDSINVSNTYTAVKIEGGTVSASQNGVLYITMTKDLSEYFGAGAHDIEINTDNGIISTSVTFPSSETETGDKVNSTDAYGRIISVTKNAANDMIYTYDTGVVRVVTFDKNGDKKDTTVTWTNGDTLVTNADGSSVMTKADGSSISYDKDGNITNIYNAGAPTETPTEPTPAPTTEPTETKAPSEPTASPTPTQTPETPTVPVGVKALDLAIGGISEGFAHEATTEDVYNDAKTVITQVTPNGKTGTMLALSDVDLAKNSTVTPTADGKYEVRFDVASIKASDNILLLHKLSNGSWEQITPKVVGNGYVLAEFTSFSPVAIIKFSDKLITPEASEESKKLDANVTSITDGFSHAPITDSSVVTAAKTAMNAMKGTSTDIYTLNAATVVTKDADTKDGKVSIGVKDVSYGDTIKLLARKTDGSFKEITSTVGDDGKVTFDSADMATGTIAVVEVTTVTVETPTPAPATEAPATEAPATEVPKTEAPTTEAPTTEAPTTSAPSTGTPAPATQTPSASDSYSDVAKAWDANIKSIAGGYSHKPVSDDVITSATTAMNELKGNSTDVYSFDAITKLGKEASAIEMKDSATLTIPLIDMRDTTRVIAQQTDGTWKEITSACTVSEDTLVIPALQFGNGNIAVIKAVKQTAQASGTPAPNTSATPSASGAPSTSGTPSPTGNSDGSTGGSTTTTTDGSTGGNTTTTTDGSSNGSSTTTTTSKSADTSGADKKAKSAQTGQSGFKMFMTYLLSGIGLK